MAMKREGTIDQVKDFSRCGKLSISVEEVEKRIASGEKLVYEASQFSDPGPDWTALYLGDQKIGYWEGY